MYRRKRGRKDVCCQDLNSFQLNTVIDQMSRRDAEKHGVDRFTVSLLCARWKLCFAGDKQNVNRDCLLCSSEGWRGDVTNQCAVGELSWCELIHTFILQFIHTLHTTESTIIPNILHFVHVGYGVDLFTVAAQGFLMWREKY